MKRGNKKNINWKAVSFVMVILLIAGGYIYFTKDKLAPSEKVITGNAFYSRTPLTIKELSNGIQLSKNWNRLVWTDDVEEGIPIGEAFESILDNTYYVYSYGERKYWFNPSERYARYNNNRWYKNRLFNKIIPGDKYYIRMKNSDVLQYSFGPQSIKIILPNLKEVIINENERYCVLNGEIVEGDDIYGSFNSLTEEQLRKGIMLDGSLSHRVRWPSTFKEGIPIEEAFESISDSYRSAFSYGANQKFWYNPNFPSGARWNNDKNYNYRLLKIIEPGEEYSIMMGGNSDILKYVPISESDYSTANQLKNGIELRKKNSIKWPNTLKDTPVEDAFGDALDKIRYIMDLEGSWSERKYWLDPGTYNDKTINRYKNRWIDNLVPGKKYSIVMKENNVVWTYTPPKVDLLSLTSDDLSEGVRLKWGDEFRWPNTLEETFIEDAFKDVLDQVYFIEQGSWSNKDVWYNSNLYSKRSIEYQKKVGKWIDRLTPGELYSIYFGVEYVNWSYIPTKHLKIIFPNGSDIIPNEDEKVCVLNGAVVEEEEVYDCSGSESIDFFIKPTLSIPDSDLYIYTKNPLDIALPKIKVKIYNSNNQFVKNIYLYNDGQHNDLEAEDYINANYFNISETGDYYAYFCGKNLSFQIIDLQIMPLYSGHNKLNADRINMILVGSGYDSIEEFKEVAKEVLSIDGKFIVFNVTTMNTDLNTGKIETYINEVKQVGFFATEPLRSNKNKFNIWYLDTQLSGSFNEFIEKVDSHQGEYFKFFDLDYIYPVLFRNKEFINEDQAFGSSVRSSARFLSFANEVALRKDNLKFGISLNHLPVLKSHVITPEKETIIEGIHSSRYSIFTHESGHALFGLADEYDTPNSKPLFRYPNCASNVFEAENWWGDLIGQVDPFYYEYIEFSGDKINEESIKIGFVNGGCVRDSKGKEEVIRSTKESIMRDDRRLPVFGSVNRRRVEQVLNLFSGN